MSESPAYQRLKQAAAQASADAALLARRTLMDIHWECVVLETEWRDRDDESAAEVRAVLSRIRAKLAPVLMDPYGSQESS